MANTILDPTRSTAMENVLRTNNEGTMHFAKGDWIGAMASFRSSLECIVTHVRATAPSAGGDPIPNTYSLPIGALHLPNRQKTYVPVTIGNQDNGAFFYERPIVFDKIMAPSQETCLILCAVVTFNMALTAHKKSEHGDSPSAAKALLLYDSSMDFFARTPGGSKTFASVMAAALNNKIQIYHTEDSFDELERDAAKLCNAIFWSKRSEITARVFEEKELEEVLLNLMLLKRPLSAGAA